MTRATMDFSIIWNKGRARDHPVHKGQAVRGSQERYLEKVWYREHLSKTSL
jgi:hypothetical protein